MSRAKAKNRDDSRDSVARLTEEVAALRSQMEDVRREGEERVRHMAWQVGDAAGHTGLPRASRPVFVLGCVRSGTTAVGKALQAAGLPGWTEGHLFPILFSLKETIDQGVQKETPFLGAGLGIDFLGQADLERTLVDYFERLCLRHHLSTRWVDKTPGPEMIEAATFLSSLWPQARFVFCRRRGIENVKSQLRRFANEPLVNLGFAEACHVWARCMETWQGVRGRLGEKFLEIDQGEMASDPDPIATRLGALLGLSAGQTAAVARSLRECLPEQTGSSYAPEAIDETGWNAAQRDLFLTVCGPAMQAYGYKVGGDADARLRAAILLPFTKDPDKVTLSNVDGPSHYRAAEKGAFLLHPRLEGEPPTVTFRGLTFQGHGRFFTALELRHSQSQPVLYRLRLRASGEGRLLVNESVVVQPGETKRWQVDFSPLSGPIDASLSTEMAPGAVNNFFAWAHWIGPRFMVT